MLEVYVDADGCPVKEEVYRVASRHGLKVWVVANGWLRVPDDPPVTRVTAPVHGVVGITSFAKEAERGLGVRSPQGGPPPGLL